MYIHKVIGVVLKVLSFEMGNKATPFSSKCFDPKIFWNEAQTAKSSGF